MFLFSNNVQIARLNDLTALWWFLVLFDALCKCWVLLCVECGVNSLDRISFRFSASAFCDANCGCTNKIPLNLYKLWCTMCVLHLFDHYSYRMCDACAVIFDLSLLPIYALHCPRCNGIKSQWNSCCEQRVHGMWNIVTQSTFHVQCETVTYTIASFSLAVTRFCCDFPQFHRNKWHPDHLFSTCINISFPFAFYQINIYEML